MVMQVYQAADQSAEENRPVDIAWPDANKRTAAEKDFVGVRSQSSAGYKE
jgi:hypothetical protein